MPNEEPNGGQLAVVVVFERHHPRHHLWLTGYTEASEEERANPQRDTERQISWKQIHHARVNVPERSVKARQATHLRDGHEAQNRGTDDHHAGLCSVGPDGGPNAARIAVGDHEDEPDEDSSHFGPTQHGAERNATRHELSRSVNGEEEDRQHTGQFGFGCPGGL